MVLEKKFITLIGTLPPIKGMSPYCKELVKSLSKYAEIEFIGFRKLYPEFLYPGGTVIKGYKETKERIKNVKVRNTLTYYNPLSWIWAGVTLKGDIVHAQWWSYPLAPIFFTILLISKIRKKRVVITVHNVVPHESSRLNNFLNESILFFGDAFITHTAINKKKLSDAYGIDSNKIHVIQIGLLPQPVRGISREEARLHLKIVDDTNVILYFGNIRDYKGLDVLIKSMGYVVKRNPKSLLVIAGQVWGSWDRYERLIREEGLEKHIIKRLEFIPPSETEYFFSSADVVVLPYKYFDSQSAIGALALPFKKPLIVTKVGGLPDFVRDERAIARPNDPKDLAEKICGVLEDEKLIAKLKKDSEAVMGGFGWDDIAKETLKVYRNL